MWLRSTIANARSCNQGSVSWTRCNVGEGQNRLGEIALAGKTVEMAVGVGMIFDAVIVVDTGHRRGRLVRDEEAARPYINLQRPGLNHVIAYPSVARARIARVYDQQGRSAQL